MTNAIDTFDLTGQTALVTGSCRGLGLGLARALLDAGARVVLNGRHDESLKKTYAMLRGQGLCVEHACFDVTNRSEVATAIADLHSRIGAIDILVNNAGIQHRAVLEDFDPNHWDALMRTNLDGVFNVTQCVVRTMIERRKGKIINICSVQSTLARPTIAPYAATKGAVCMLTRGMCADWARYGIQINGLAPGYFRTELNQDLVTDPEFSEWLCRRTPAGRWGEVEELSGALLLLASKASDFINGQVLYVDGGLTSVV
ncbi:SDR family oxidoreductase [Pseudomonas putida]|uniref:SDR family NAD(P)-dependent oxidoreductase n=1 Tax=Pseudomonas putida TaxID=303 RepID=UPI0023632BCF|nr:SDR family NAD(P)-dependent oxidoreductase [Pseudomonas putida]MDD2067815.1 SDR family oxidoreductase [Pseudomonas putida]HDS1738298.1 SDR family NAD(P)-dependent oxidoreductase [Pseudomonas putida]